MDQKTDIAYLEDFLHNNPEMERLETLAEEFNIFASLKIIDVEIRHSNFLAWLLDPSENHGFGCSFLKSFLKMISYSIFPNQDNYPSVFDIDSWDLDQVQIKREWKHIDLLILDPINSFVCVIENKINSSGHDKQLQHYREIIDIEYSDFRHKIFLYLTVEKEIPSDDSYLPINYSEIIPLVEHLIRTKEDKTSKEIITFISHYIEIVKRYIMKDSKIQDICKTIYKQHKRALDLIFDNRSDNLSTINEILVDMIQEDDDFKLDDTSKMEIKFTAKFMDFLPCEGEWTSSKYLLCFDFLNYSDGLSLTLYLSPSKIDLREKIYNITKDNPNIFNKANRNLAKGAFLLYKNIFLDKNQIVNYERDEIQNIIKDKFENFKQTDLRNIEKVLSKLKYGLE